VAHATLSTQNVNAALAIMAYIANKHSFTPNPTSKKYIQAISNAAMRALKVPSVTAMFVTTKTWMAPEPVYAIR